MLIFYEYEYCVINYNLYILLFILGNRGRGQWNNQGNFGNYGGGYNNYGPGYFNGPYGGGYGGGSGGGGGVAMGSNEFNLGKF